MRNMKKFLALVLAMLMVFSMAVITTSAADEADYTDAALQLNALKVMQGDLEGNLMLDADVTRYQTALFFVRALTGKTGTDIWNAEKTSANFADVQEYGTAIDYAYGVGVVRGRGNGVFGFNDKILYKDMIVMAIRALGYETADMSYPYGHILAADKLNLLEGIDNVNYDAALNRGETAQLIWNMLGTEVAVVDPLTDKVIYPGDPSLTGSISDEFKEELANRKTLLEESGLAGGKFTAVITEFVPADEDDEEDYDKIVLDGDMTLKAADFGITAETPAISYLGLEVEVFFNSDEEEFTEEDYEEGDATIVLARYPEYTVVENVGADANIKYVPNEDDDNKSYVSLGGTKFTNKDYEGELFLFTEDGWARQPQTAWESLAAAYRYDSKDGYIGDGNTYGQAAYRVIEVEDDKSIVEVLYTPYTFGQYITRELKYNVTGKDASFTIIGEYNDGATWTNLDEEEVYFKEYFVGATSAVTNKTVSKKAGEAAVDVVVEGVDIKSGEFMFYYYNAVDNILTVAANCGSIETGRLTAYSNTKETYKISGTNYEFGFAGLYDAFAAYDEDYAIDRVENLVAKEDNVQYLAVDGKIVWIADYEGETTTTEYDFAIVSFDHELLADLLDMTDAKFANKLTYTDGLMGGYYVEDGYVVAAVLNTENGEWELGKIEAVAAGWEEAAGGPEYNNGYNEEDEEYDSFVDIATIVKYAEIANLATAKQNDLDAAELVLSDWAPFYAVVEENDGVYTLAGGDFITYANNEDGLTFNANGRTNPITADPEVDPARVTTTENTVLVVVTSEGTIEIRKGVQTSKKDIVLGEDEYATFLAADASLIVMFTNAADALDWGTGSAADTDENYFVVLPTFGVEYETEADEECTLTITGLFDLKAMEEADDIVITAETMTELKNIVKDFATGDLIYMNANGDLMEEDVAELADALAYLLGEDYVVADVLSWTDDETIEIDGLTTSKALAGINATVITLDLTEIDWKDDVDTDNFFLGGVAYDAEAYEELGLTEMTVKGGVLRYAYHINLDDVVAEITEPTLGLFSNFEIDNGDEIVYELFDENERGREIYDVDYFTVATLDEDTDEVTLYVVRLVNDLFYGD